MEVDTASADVNSPDKASKDGEMDFEITMNDSDGEEDASLSDKPTPNAVNGKASEDEDSHSSERPRVTRSKTRKSTTAEEDAKQSNGSSVSENGNSQDSQHSESKAKGDDDDSQQKCDDKESVEEKDDKKSSEDSVDKSGKESEEEDVEKKKHSEDERDKNDSEEEKMEDEKKKDEEEEEAKDDEDEDESDGDTPKTDKGKESEKKVKESAKKDSKKKDSASDDDDDVVMIGDSPAKPNPFSSHPLISVSGTSFGGVTVGSSLILDARSGVSVPYMTSMAGASLVPSASGIQLVLPPGTPGVSGSGVMYMPTSLPYSSSIFTTIGGSIPRNSNPMLMSHYSGFASAPVRSMLASQMIGKAAASPLAPVLQSMPEKPTSSIGMFEMLRWEQENHINIKPKYVKPNPKAELGNLAKWHFDLGADLVKEYVYHDLVRIQLKRKDDGNLSTKEQDDFNKLQEIDRELNEKVGHLKFQLTKSCKCGFKTESDSVLYDHMLRPHVERGGFFSCAMCKYSCRQPNAFRFHMETEHARVAKMESKHSFYECALCPYESNYTNRLEQHKTRCLRQFREAFNLHPSCMTGPEVNMSLENVFYFVFTRQFMNSIIPPSTNSLVQAANKHLVSGQTRGMGGNPRMANTSLTTSTRNLAPRTINQGTTPNRNYPVISSQINTGSNIRNATANTGSMTPRMPTAPNANQPNSGFEVCEICGGYVKDRKALRIHFFYAHRIDMPFGVFERPQAPLYCATCFSRFWTAQGLQKHIEVHKNELTANHANNGVAGKCISCGHRVPNILMHMRMVHNRELRHYLAALMCIFCGQRCPSKVQVEQHMNRVHGVIVKNSGNQGPNLAPIPPLPQVNNARTMGPASKQQPQQQQGKPAEGKSGRSSTCVLCNLSFSRNVDLTRHCMRVHHTCMKCGLVVVDKDSLSRHTCLHSASGMRGCQICGDNGFHPAYYIKHMRDKHLRKCSVVLRRIDRAVVETLKRPITISDSEDDEPVCKQAKDDDGDGKDVEMLDEEKKEQGSDNENGGDKKNKDEEEDKSDDNEGESDKQKQNSSNDSSRQAESDEEGGDKKGVDKKGGDASNGEPQEEDKTAADDSDSKLKSDAKKQSENNSSDMKSSEADGVDGASDSEKKSDSNAEEAASRKRKLETSSCAAPPPSKKTARKSIRPSSTRKSTTAEDDAKQSNGTNGEALKCE